MIVTLAAWLYIIQALLGLGSLFSGPFGLGGGMASFATLLVSAIFGAMGYGLLKRDPRARWLALGVSLLSWVFGSLLLVSTLAVLAMSGHAGEYLGMMFSGAFAIFAVLIVIFLLIMLVSVVISFKLFFYLCSQEGCEEFGVPYGSAGTVVASVGAWIAIMIGEVFMSSGGSGGLALLLAQQAMSRDERHAAEPDPEQMQLEAERREYARRHEEQQRLAEQEARLQGATQESLDQPTEEPAAADTAQPEVVDTGYSQAVASEAPAPALSQPADEEPVSASQIVKCKDASGSVQFTQGYCPPGTQRVDMPKSE